jgi:hypothetical protein
MKKLLSISICWFLALHLHAAENPKTSNSSRTTFNPIGKTPSELEEKWGKPTARMELGDTVEIIFKNAVVTVEKGKVTSCEYKKGSGGSSAQSSSQTSMSSGGGGANDVTTYVKRLEGDLEAKNQELSSSKWDYERANDAHKYQEKEYAKFQKNGGSFYRTDTETPIREAQSKVKKLEEEVR